MMRLKKLVLGTPLERVARALYIRLDPSPGSEDDRLTLAVMRRCLRATSNCVDIGAHRGSILAEIVRQAPKGIHYAFEPVPAHSRYLREAFPQVRVHEMALSNVREQTVFLHDLQHPTRSSFRRWEGAAQNVEVLNVQTERLDDVLPPGWVVDFIKVDVEGAELAVLQGAEKTLRKQHPVLVFEHSRLAQVAYNVMPGDLHRFLTQECGLRIWLMKAWLAQADAVSEAAFEQEVMESRSQYFVAH